jgi:murein DD-endopeptidase
VFRYSTFLYSASRRLCVALAVTLALSACSTTPRTDDDRITQRAVDVAISMQGKPYRFGGNTPVGFDCSGLIQYSYARAGVQLPRTTEELLKASRTIARRQLRPGDLVFFHQDGKRSSHVGLYIGNDRFVHAPSTGKHVTLGGLDEPYWKRNFASARRLTLE